MKKIMLIIASLCIAGCQGTGPYVYPGYYQPAQYQAAYVTEGSYDALGNYHPPMQKGGQYLPGRWYRAQPSNPGPNPQRIYAERNPYSSTTGEINKLSTNGDVATAPTCRYSSC